MELDEGDLHVWPVELRASDEVAAAFEKSLSAEESERCRRFHQAQHRRRYALSHGVLRVLLGRYLRISPEKIAFRSERAGKPILAFAGASLSFNMSHTEDLAVYAFAHDCQLGVDVEHVRPLPDLEQIARRFFSSQECSQLLALESADRVAAFFRCWTRKEAYIKAVGDGLSMPLDQFQVSLAAGEPAALLRPAKSHAGPWHMRQLELEKGYIGAVVYDGALRTLRDMPALTAGDVLFQACA